MSRALARSLVVAGVAASAVALNILPASAAPIGFTIDQESGQLASIDAGANSVTGIGGEDGLIDSLALACDGTLFGIEAPDDDFESASLVTIDTTTGATTSIGVLGLDRYEYGMAFAPDGTLWLSTGDDLYRADVTTGATTLVGPFFDDSGTEMNSLAFDVAGTLYGYDDDRGRLFTIDPATAAATEVGSSDFSMGDVLGLDFDGAGTLWAIARTDGTGTATFDLTTGEGDFVGGGQISAQGLALTSLPCPPPPSTTTTSTTSTSTSTTTPAPAPRPVPPVVVQPRFTG